ncbi:MAG: 2-isopropylmalate synthase [Firmicutes bacterium RBG_13_65_8]|nr:MAG: 2-isopropylmalate synthase [Firmicutes bacterium RBG_13_65_8]
MDAQAGTERRIIIFDTTLRDGEQSPGVSLSHSEKLEMAAQLARLAVDVIEAGFPISSPGDFAAVRAIAEASRDWEQNPVICALSRAIKADIDAAWRAVQASRRPRIHTFISTSPVQMQYQLRKSEKEVLNQAVEAVTLARSYCEDVEFSAMDASRSDLRFLKEIYRAAFEAGATTLNVPDTVGYALPAEFAALVREIASVFPADGGPVISVHTHNDLGLAVANALAALDAGATQIECAVNGIGERAGNASLEECVMAVHTRRDVLRAYSAVRTGEIYRTSRMVSALTGIVVPPNKAVVGANAFAHESGIHQDGVLKMPKTYEIMDPVSIGRPQSRLVLGKLSGSHAFRNRLAELGIRLPEEQIARAFAQFKELADRKGEIGDGDLEAIVGGALVAVPEAFSLEYFQISTGNRSVPTATVKLRIQDGSSREEAATGDGPVHAMYHAVDRLTGLPVVLTDYALNAATSGKDALGEVTVKLEYKGHVYSGRGVSTDVLEASLRAYIHALNKIVANGGRAMPNGRGAQTPAVETAAGGTTAGNAGGSAGPAR